MLRFSRVFSDGMIIQRGKDFEVWGWADGDVRLSLYGADFVQSARVTYEGDKFAARFAAVTDTVNSYEIVAEHGVESVRIKVRFGDVYLMIGQSNMSYVLSATENWQAVAARAAKADIAALSLTERNFTTLEEITRPVEPQSDLAHEYKWVGGDNKDISGVSALSVMTATILSEKRGVPVGVVDGSMGGLCVEAYVPREDYERDEKLLAFGKKVQRYQSVEQYNDAGIRNFTQIAGVYNEKISPLIGFNFAGIVWYLGESSACDFEFAKFFTRAMCIVIERYREMFDCPFVGVGIACENYLYGDGHGYEYVNEALADLEDKFDHYTYVPIYDIEPRWLKYDGDMYYHPIHPVNKLPVAERIAHVLDGGGRFPRIESVHFGSGKAVLKVRGDKLREGSSGGFTLAGRSGKYYPAEATVYADRVEVSSRDVPEPAKLTYAFKPYQDACTLVSESGLPVFPYRTERKKVSPDYCFTPAYCETNANEVYENSFGWRVGPCRKVPVWRDSEIYGHGNCEVSAEDGVVTATAHPDNESFYLFGVSPAICLAGHKHHLADYNYLNFELCADSGEVAFLGVIARAASGEVVRFALCNGGENVDALKVGKDYKACAVNLTCGLRGDDAAIDFDKKIRSSFVQMEFMFRSRENAKIRLRKLTLSDSDFSEKGEKTDACAMPARADTNLPS